MPECCYSSAKRGVGDSHSCQFSDEALTDVQGHFFCDFHLPWSSRDLRDRFSIILKDADDHVALKKNWASDRIADFTARLKVAYLNARDLTGVVAVQDLAIDGVATLTMPDAVFPKQFQISGNVQTVDLRNSLFLQPAIFGYGPAKLDVSGSTFISTFSYSAKNVRNADFSKCHFKDRVSFRNCIFYTRAQFTGATFKSYADFEGADFKREGLEFGDTIFYGPANFRTGEEINVGYTSFVRSVFYHEVGFQGREFKSRLSFRDAKFHRAPRFQNCEISFESSFPGIEGFLDWQVIPDGIAAKSSADRRDYYEAAAQAYRTLRFEMKEQEAHDEEALFWELEMKAKERSLPWSLSESLPKLISKLYGLTARYGNSVVRPIFSWFFVFCIFAFVYSVFHQMSYPFNLSAYLQVTDLSFQQTVRPFGVWSEDGIKTIMRSLGNVSILSDGQILAIRAISTFQTVVSLTFLALFGFAIRRRFRMA